MIKLYSEIQLGEKMGVNINYEYIIKKEPQFFSSNYKFSYENGGPITKDFLTRIPEEITSLSDFIFDSRVHMLMPGWFPCIPGWHLDDVPRERSDGQPNHLNPSYRSNHVCALVGDCSVTSYIDSQNLPIELDEPELGKTIYKEWDEEIERRVKEGTLREFSFPTNRLIYFNWQTLHKGKWLALVWTS